MDKPRIGLLGLTLEFYQTRAPHLKASREAFVRQRLMPALAGVADVRFDGAVYTRQTVEAALDAMAADGVDAVCVVLLSYSPSLISAPALARGALPVVVWNTQELRAVTESYSSDDLIANHGVHGTHDLCNVLNRAGRAFGYVTGHPDDGEAIAELGEFFQAARAVRRLRRARLGLLGYPFPGMGDFGLDTTHLATTLGCAWTQLPLADYLDRCRTAPAGEVEQLAGEYRSAYAVADDVAPADLAAAARAEIALRGLVQQHRLDALSYQFLAFGEDGRAETLPFVAASRLLAEGVGFGGEGDLVSAAGSALLGWLAEPASFSEIFTIDFAGNAVLLSHMGEANVAMARRDRPVPLLRRQSLVPITGEQLVLQVTFEPGEATLTALTLGPGGRWRILAAPITFEDFGPLPQLPVPHSKARPVGDVRTFLTNYARAGGPHHLAVCVGDARARLRTAAALLGADYVEIES